MKFSSAWRTFLDGADDDDDDDDLDCDMIIYLMLSCWGFVAAFWGQRCLCRVFGRRLPSRLERECVSLSDRYYHGFEDS